MASKFVQIAVSLWEPLHGASEEVIQGRGPKCLLGYTVSLRQYPIGDIGRSYSMGVEGNFEYQEARIGGGHHGG